MPLPTAPLAACPVCDASERETVLEVEYVYRRCGSCGTVYQDPRLLPEAISRAYPAGYFTHAEPDPGRKPLLREMRPWKGSGRALDVGCGAGALLGDLNEGGWQAFGLEIDPQAAEVARRSSGREVTVGSLESASLSARSFDLVTLSHSFEHLPDPKLAIRRVAGLLTPGGRAVLIVPNPRALGARAFGAAWVHWDPPRHLVLPDRQSLPVLARLSGLALRSWRTLSRNARLTFRQSRPDGRRLPIDALRARLETALVALGLPAGEELLAVFEAAS